MPDPSAIQSELTLLKTKVGEYFKAVEEWKKYKRADKFYQMCSLEKELKQILNPEKVSQQEFEWLSQ